MVSSLRRPAPRYKTPPKRRQFTPAAINGLAGQITSEVARLTQQTLQEITRPRDGYTIKQYKELVETEPLSAACVQLKRLRAMTSFGEYEHTDKEIQEFVRDNFEEMNGSLKMVVGEMASALPYGFSVAEIVFSSNMPSKRGQWRIERINPLDPERVSFAGCKGKITHVVYNDGDRKKYIDYRKCIHVVNGLSFGDPFGSAEARRAMPYYRAKNLIYGEMMVAGKNNASGMILAQADSADTVEVKGADGRPLKNPDGSKRTMSGPEALLYQMKGLEGSGIIATDLKNRVSAIVNPSGENFWNLAIQLLKKEILLAFLVPSLIWDEGSAGLGNTGLSGNHKSTLDSNISAIVEQIQEEILNKLVCHLISWNYGYRKDYGSFSSQPYTDPQMMMSRATNLLSALSSGVIPQSDIDAVNRLREDLGVPPLSREQMTMLLQMNIEQQQMQQAAMTPPAQTQTGFSRSNRGYYY